MDSTDDTPLASPWAVGESDCYCHECREARGEQVVERGRPTQPQNVIESDRQLESEVVGPHGETRVQARGKLLDALTDFAELVRAAQDKGEISGKDAYRLRLQIHRERCALLGLGYANGVTW